MLTSCFHIYLSPNGRINLGMDKSFVFRQCGTNRFLLYVGGLPSSYTPYLVSSLCQVLRVQPHL